MYDIAAPSVSEFSLLNRIFLGEKSVGRFFGFGKVLGDRWLVPGVKSQVSGVGREEIRSRRSDVGDRKSEVRGRKSEVRDRRSEE